MDALEFCRVILDTYNYQTTRSILGMSQLIGEMAEATLTPW